MTGAASLEVVITEPTPGHLMNIFDFRHQLIADYASYIQSFIHIRDPKIREYVQGELSAGFLWPHPLIQLNPSFAPGAWMDTLVGQNILHPACAKVFRKGKEAPETHGVGRPLRLYTHQEDAIRTAQQEQNYLLTTGTGSGKSLAYIIPIVEHVLKHESGRGIRAIVVYPMNALANSQYGELEKFLCHGYPDGKGPVTFARYTGQESEEQRHGILANPPDILLTNYVMLELILTRPAERPLIAAAQGLRFLVLDELHTYRGRQRADVALLVRRVRDVLSAHQLQCVGTSATLAGSGSYDEQRAEVASVTTQLFGSPVTPENVIGETLRRVTPEKEMTDPTFVEALRQRLTDTDAHPPKDYQGFINDPLSIWIEGAFGITTEPASGRLIRTPPRSLWGENGAARELSDLTGVPVDRCIDAIQEGLLGGYECEPDPETGLPPFAFRLHQFISRGGSVFASLELESERYLTVNGQQYVPSDRSRVLLPLVFCRECGQDYFCVWKTAPSHDASGRRFTSRELTDSSSDDAQEAGFLYVSSDDPWPHDPQALLQRLPDDWVEETLK
jgi:hypothetical protein